MSRDPLASSLHDVAAGLLTPFDQSDPSIIHWDALEETAQWLASEGIGVFLACANISEYHSLTHEERVKSVEVASSALPSEATVLGGVGGSTTTAVELAGAAEDNDADGIMVMPPDHTFKHEAGVVAHFDRIADAVDIGTVPYIRGFDVTVDLVERIVRHQNVVGVKWAISDIELFAACVDAARDDCVWVCGMAEPPAPAYYAEGAVGFSAGVSNFCPRAGLALFDALEAGEWERARAIRNLCQPLMDLRKDPGEDNSYPGGYSVQVVKEGLRLAGREPGGVRTPLVEITDLRRQAVEREYQRLQQGLDDIEQSGIVA